MVEQAQLNKILRDAMKTGKYTVGFKETVASMKGTKAIICSRSIPAANGAKLREEAGKHKVAVVDLPISSAELARIVGKPYRISALALRSIGDADLKQLTK